ncbi:MAG: adenylosuccinate synthase [Anaerolineaceae bacterium]|nr:adenylosuccinate synthase [Anaerolineaceae bacterium]
MPFEIVVGSQWGDEGKGRFVDLLSEKANVVARFNGGDNAGHTVAVGKDIFKLHHIPSGIIHSHSMSVMGTGMVINPISLKSEIDELVEAGIPVSPQKLKISFGAHLITPAHRIMDRVQEKKLGNSKIGTTGRGIGPTYSARASRRGLRLLDILNLDTFREKLKNHFIETNDLLVNIFDEEPLDIEKNIKEFEFYTTYLKPFIGDVSEIVLKALAAGQFVLGEGAQGTMLDIDWGTYPYVTSSNTIAPSAFIGLGIGIRPVDEIIGVAKAFLSRVGAGAMPTELFGDMSIRLRGSGANPWDEFGTTTGRPRRVGWLDAVLLKHAVQLNGISALAITKLDILSGLKKIKMCTAYQKDGKSFEKLPYGASNISDFEPIYEELDGWEEDVTMARQWSDLPNAAQAYIKRIETYCGVPVKWISVGPERDQVVIIDS